MRVKPDLKFFSLPEDTLQALTACADLVMPESIDELYELCCLGMEGGRQVINYNVDNGQLTEEAELVLCKNGLAVNFSEHQLKHLLVF